MIPEHIGTCVAGYPVRRGRIAHREQRNATIEGFDCIIGVFDCIIGVFDCIIGVFDCIIKAVDYKIPSDDRRYAIGGKMVIHSAMGRWKEAGT